MIHQHIFLHHRHLDLQINVLHQPKQHKATLIDLIAPTTKGGKTIAQGNLAHLTVVEEDKVVVVQIGSKAVFLTGQIAPITKEGKIIAQDNQANLIVAEEVKVEVLIGSKVVYLTGQIAQIAIQDIVAVQIHKTKLTKAIKKDKEHLADQAQSEHAVLLQMNQ